MIFELKLRKVGNSVGLVLPRAALDHLGVGSSDRVCFTAGCRSLAKLATAYILALTERQPFQSGNVAMAFLVGITFLRVNGRVLSGKEGSAAANTANLAAGQCPEAFYTHWLYANT